MNRIQDSHEATVSPGTLSTVVVYEDLSTHDRAAVICDDLVKQFWPEIRFKFDWWRVNFFEDDGFAELASQSALTADIIIFCGRPDMELGAATKRWFEKWCRRRDGRDGALVDLTDLTETASTSNGDAELKKLYLRDVAGRALMDYVTKPPAAISLSLQHRHAALSARSTRIPSRPAAKTLDRQSCQPLVHTED